MKTIYFDFETSSLPIAEIKEMEPEFSAPGNYKDPTKIADNIAEQKAKWIEDAALSALTGRIVALGLEINGQFVPVIDDDETVMVREFWKQFSQLENRKMIGFCCKHFDLRFVVRRSFKLSVPIPAMIAPEYRWEKHGIVDLADYWQCGDRQDRISLDEFARFLGVGRKNGNGGDFARMLVEHRETAIQYLANDLRLTRLIAEKVLS